MPEGEVKWFSDEKGFGFIEPDEGDEDVFVHHSDIQVEGYASLKEGQRVSYELAQTEKGPKALQVNPGGEGTSAESEDDIGGAPPRA